MYKYIGLIYLRIIEARSSVVTIRNVEQSESINQDLIGTA